MPMVPANAVTRVLTWRDFPKRDVPPPPPGDTVTAAQTNVFLSDTGGDPARVKGSSRAKLAAEPTVRVTFPSQSWLRKFLYHPPPGQPDALLYHDQIHHMIPVLCARDQPNELRVIMQTHYADVDELTAAVLATRALPDNQALQDKYDFDTKSLP